jgi:DNA-binding MarR family transcriptional regulator
MSSIMVKQVDNVNHRVTPVATPDGNPADAVVDLVHTVMHRFRALQYESLRDHPQAVTHLESKVMSFFAAHPGATQSELAQHSGRDKAQLARLLKGLRERGLLAAEADPADRRNVHLRLSPQGHAVQRTLQREARQVALRAVKDLSDTEQRALVALLARVKASLDDGA